MLNARRKVPKFRANALIALYFGLVACHPPSIDGDDSHPIIGTWLVTIPEAPFPLHMFVFHSDGTVQQSNPDAGNPNTSDSSAMGVWLADHDGIRGKLVELTADRSTHQFISRGEISFSLKVDGNALSGTAIATFYDSTGQSIRGPIQATLKGERVVP
jgi:hypothetical protein